MDVVRSVLNNLGFDLTIFLSQIALFYILHILLKPILYKPMEQARAERQKVTQDRVDEAERVNSQALELKRQYEQSLRQTQKEALAITQRAQEQVELQRQQALDSARAEAVKIISKTRDELANEQEIAEQELQEQVPALALALACKLAGSVTDGEVSKELVARLQEVG